MRRIACLLVVMFAAPASAQSVNVNFSAGPAPSATYAAAGAAGTWNAVTGIAGTTFKLVGLDGSKTPITVSQSPTTTLLTDTDPSVTGDDATLLDTGLVTTGAETRLAFNGFQPGTYEVLVYAWVPNGPTVKSRTRQDEAPTTIDVGGAWTGAHAVGVTYARYVVTVGNDGNLPAHSGLVPGQPSAALNGIQIRPLPDVESDAGVGAADDAGGGSPETGDAGTDSAHHGGGCNSGRGVARGCSCSRSRSCCAAGVSCGAVPSAASHAPTSCGSTTPNRPRRRGCCRQSATRHATARGSSD